MVTKDGAGEDRAGVSRPDGDAMLLPVSLDVDLRTRESLIAFWACSVVEDFDRPRKETRFPELSWVAVPVTVSYTHLTLPTILLV